MTNCIESPAAAVLHPWGLAEYGEILRLQEELRKARMEDEISDTWLVGEHPDVITQGVRSSDADLTPAVTPQTSGESRPTPVFTVDRGGMATIHSPGQLVIYPIVRIRGGSMSAGRFSRELLDRTQTWLGDAFGVNAEMHKGSPGLYAGDRKLASIGISARGGITMHGIAINFSNDLEIWDSIVACGDAAIRPITLTELAGRTIHPSDQIESLAGWLRESWGYASVVIKTADSAREPAASTSEAAAPINQQTDI